VSINPNPTEIEFVQMIHQIAIRVIFSVSQHLIKGASSSRMHLATIDAHLVCGLYTYTF